MFAYGQADAIANHCLLLQKIQIGFTFLVTAHTRSPGQSLLGRKMVVVVPVVVITDYICHSYPNQHEWHYSRAETEMI